MKTHFGSENTFWKRKHILGVKTNIGSQNMFILEVKIHFGVKTHGNYKHETFLEATLTRKLGIVTFPNLS